MAASPPDKGDEQLLTRLLCAVDERSAAGWAESLLELFPSLSAVLAAPQPALARVVGAAAATSLSSIRETMLYVARAEAYEGPVISTSEALLRYLHLDMAREPVERFRVLFLNAQNRLLDETVADGCVSEAPVYPREIMRRALAVGATALILVHNHPSGDPTPSVSDVQSTQRIADAGEALEIEVHDHVIIARSGWTSFRALGLLGGNPKKSRLFGRRTAAAGART